MTTGYERVTGPVANIALPDGTQTIPGQPLTASTGNCKAALRDLALAFPGGPAGVTVADLGCLDGAYAAEFARAGYDVTGIEARRENYERALRAQAALGLPGLTFICGDAREVLPGKTFDAVFCSGLLYHLDRPVAFLDLLGRVTRRVLILSTHVSMPGGHDEAWHHPGEYCDPPETGPEGRAGHWSHEPATPWASYGNTSSFWLTRESLLLSLHAAGFAVTFEQFDWRDPDGSGTAFDRSVATAGVSSAADRVMIVAFKPPGGN